MIRRNKSARRKSRQVRLDRTWARLHESGRGVVRCHLCGDVVLRCEASLEHVVPRSVGGGHDDANLRISHQTCNSNAGGMLNPNRPASPVGAFRAHDGLWRWAKLFRGVPVEVSRIGYPTADDARAAAELRGAG